jgi:tetratricopeptide (TPR) repeat protein
LNLAKALRAQGHYDEARTYAERALALLPEDPRVLDLLGSVSLKGDEPAKAADFLFRALQAGYESVALQDDLVTALLLLDRGDEALIHAQRVYELELNMNLLK